jgi:cell filamentation protein
MGKYDVLNDEFEPGSNGLVLKNHLGITDPAEMDVVESEALRLAQLSFYSNLDSEHRFTVQDLKNMHRFWLGEIYSFSGKLRSVDVGKDGFQFASVQFLQSNLQNFERSELAALTPCKAQSIEECADKIARVHGEFIMLHPFREGNGRLGRWLADSMAFQAGLPAPKYGFESEDLNCNRAQYLNAVKKAVLLETDELKQFFCEALSRALSNPS